MRSLSERGFATILIVIAIVVAVSGAGATAYYVKKSSDEKKAREVAAQQSADTPSDAPKQPKPTETPKPVQTPPVTPACVRDTKMYVSVAEGHALRNEKALNATKLVAVPFRGEVTVGCKDGDWYSAEFNGKVGYAYGEYLSATQPPVSTISSPTQAWCDSHGQSPFIVYAAKSPTFGFYHWSNPTGSLTEPIAFGTKLAETYCPAGGAQSAGYVLFNDSYIKFSDVSISKP